MCTQNTQDPDPGAAGPVLALLPLRKATLRNGDYFVLQLAQRDGSEFITHSHEAWNDPGGDSDPCHTRSPGDFS